jgi:hypothetical protein
MNFFANLRRRKMKISEKGDGGGYEDAEDEEEDLDDTWMFPDGGQEDNNRGW